MSAPKTRPCLDVANRSRVTYGIWTAVSFADASLVTGGKRRCQSMIS